MNTDAAFGAVGPAPALLRAGSYQLSFFPIYLVTSRDALLMISFSVCGVMGLCGRGGLCGSCRANVP